MNDALYRIMDIPEIVKPEPKAEKPKTEFIKDKIVPNGQMNISQTIVQEVKKEPVTETQKTDIKNSSESVKTVFDTKNLSVAQSGIFKRNYESDSVKVEEKPAPVVEKETKSEEVAEAQPVAKAVEEVLVNEVREKVITTSAVEEKVVPASTETEVKQPVKAEFRLIGQIFNTYIIIERENNMIMIDQHAAHERLNYEKLKKELEQKQVYSQMLLIPAVVNLSANEMAVFAENAEFIYSIGFDAEEFGNNTVIIRSVPIAAIEDEVSDLFVEIISQLADNKKEIISQKRERLLYTIACKAAVKANCKLDEKEQKTLVEKVFGLENINTCPHGRPIMISMSEYEIEKQFKRIV